MLKKPEVTVDKWTLDELLDGRETVFHDRENPDLNYRIRVFVRDGSMYMEISNAAGTGVTGRRRPVKRPTQPEPVTPEAICRQIWQEELERPIDPGGLADCVHQLASGRSPDAIREGVRQSDEYKELQRRKGELGPAEAGRVAAERDVFRHESGSIWSWQGATMFLLFRRFLHGEDITPELHWMRRQRMKVARVLGMVAWEGVAFGPTHPDYFQALEAFTDAVRDNGLRLEFTVFADAQHIVPEASRQREHLRRVLDTIGQRPNVFVEICNEPFQNGVRPSEIFSPRDVRHVPMAYGDYHPTTTRGADGVWRAHLPVLDYLTIHLRRDHAWMRAAKDLHEFREGAGDGRAENTAILEGLHVPCVSDEPLGAAEPDRVPGRQRSDRPEEFFWHHATAHLMGAGSTFHFDDGLQGRKPAFGSRQQECAAMATLAWSSVPPDVQRWQYTRGGLSDCPLAFDERYFPEATSRLYAKISGGNAMALAVRPEGGWRPEPVNGWRIRSTTGPMDSLVWLER